MLFLGWLAVCFLVVGLINFYLRRFGLPKRRVQAGELKSTGYGSTAFSGSGTSIGGLLHGAGFSRGAVGASGETVHWINSILSWIYQTQSRVPDFVDSWLTSLTTEAEHQAKELQVLFEGIHGSPPEFSDFRTEASSSDRSFTILTAVTLKDVTLQTSVLGKSTSTKATQPVKCDVYIQNLSGQVRSRAQLEQNELGLQLEFVSEPTLKLQIRPTRVDYTVDNVAFEKIVRLAISKAPMRINWTSHSTTRPSRLRIVEPNNIERSPARRLAAGSTGSAGSAGSAGSVGSQLSPRSPPTLGHPSSSFVDGYHDVSPSSTGSSAFATPSPPPAMGSPDRGDHHQPPLTQQAEPANFRGQQLAMTSRQHEQQYPGTFQGQHEQQYPRTLQGQHDQQYPGQQQVLSSVQGQQYSPPIQGPYRPNLLQGQSLQGTPLQGHQPTGAQGQFGETLSLGPKLFVRVVKANGLVDTDFGNCSAFCQVHVDSPPQVFTTNVIRNTVNPYWDEQFISEFDSKTKQIEFEILDRDRQPGNDLLGKAVVLVDEIRRMPSSKQIIPLTGKPKSRTSTSGSVTVEFIFQDSPESPSSLSTSSNPAATPFAFSQGSTPSTASSGGQKSSLSSTAGGHTSRKDDKTRAVGSVDYSPYGAGRSSSGAVGTGASQLSAHNLALTPTQPGGTKIQESPTVVVTGVEQQKSATLQASMPGAVGNIDGKKKESFANTLKRTLGRVKIKPRSQSADRSGKSSLREGNLLRPPDHTGSTVQGQQSAQQQTNKGTGSTSDLGAVGSLGNDGTVRKGRSNSFSSSLRRIFRRDKKDISREGSMTRPAGSPSGQPGGGGEGGSSREALNDPNRSFDRSRRQNTPVPSGDRFASGGGVDFPYSSSVPAPTSPLQRT